MISGPIPAQSPNVIPMRAFLLLLLMLLIVIEFAQSSTSMLSKRRAPTAQRQTLNAKSESFDVSLCAEAGNPAFLYALGFFLKQFFLDV